MTTVAVSEESREGVRAWERNGSVSSCRRCKAQLGVINWKHHCRSCGRIFCDKCSSFYLRLPSFEMCPNHPNYVTQREPQRCCYSCSQRVKANVVAENRRIAQQCRNIIINLRMKVTDTLELQRMYPTKLYIVHLAEKMVMKPNQVMSLNLEGNIHHVIVPRGLHPGDVFYVRANDGFVGPHVSRVHLPVHQILITEIVVVDSDSLEQLLTNPDSPSVTVPPNSLCDSEEESSRGSVEHVPEDEYLECSNCTYHNFLHAKVCHMCKTRLPS